MRKWLSKRVWTRLAVGLAILVAIALIANAFMDWYTERQLQSRIKAIRAGGDPASIADLEPKPIPDEENAAAILDQLDPRIDAFSKDYARFFDSPMGEAYDELTDRGERPSNEQLAAARAILDKYPDITAGLMAAAACQKYASTADFTVDHVKFLDNHLKNQAGGIRTVARFVEWQADVLLADGQHEAAVERGLALLRLARHYDAEPLLVSYLVGVAVRGITVNLLYDALAAGHVRPELHTALDGELALHDTPQRILNALKTDRAYSASVAADASANPVFHQLPFYATVVDWPMKRSFIGAMDFIDTQIALVARSWPNANIQIGRAGAQQQTSFGVMADLLIPAQQASYEAEARITATMRALRIYNALRQFAEEHGREAEGIEVLMLPKAALIDPYSGQPLKLKPTDAGWVIYSVMGNRVDDGGDFRELKDYGVAPTKLRRTE